jgi:hypothetical protein
MKKGRYYIGDPCYIFPDSWEDVLMETNSFEGNEWEINRETVVGELTAYGDICYYDNEGRAYGVDSGLFQSFIKWKQ